VQQLTSKDVDKLKEGFKDQLEYFRSTGQAKIGQLDEQLNRVESGAVDLVKEFGEDTAESKRALSASELRLKKCMNTTNEQLAGFGRRLHQIREGRLQQAISLHDEIDKSKGAMTEELAKAVGTIEQMKHESEQANEEMDKDQVHFNRMLAAASQLTSNHDDDLLAAMAKKTSELDNSHGRLMKWQRKFKHMAFAYNAEIERKLSLLTGSIGNDEDQIASARLKAELGMQAGMRSMQQGVEKEVVEAVGRETRQVSGLVNGIRNDMQHVFGAQSADENRKQAELSAAQSEIGSAQASSQKEIEALQQGGIQVAQKSDQYKSMVQNAGDELQGAMSLHTLSASEENIAYDAKMKTLTQRLAELGGASLLETGERAVAQVEVQALQALIAKLKEANQNLRDQDQKLQRRVETIRQQLSSAGWTLPHA